MHSALDVGLLNANITGLSCSAAISLQIVSVKVAGTPATPKANQNIQTIFLHVVLWCEYESTLTALISTKGILTFLRNFVGKKIGSFKIKF